MAQTSDRDIRRPVIGVTGSNRNFSPSWLCIRLAIWLAGGQALRISVDHHVPVASLEGIVISGGDDIHPSMFGGEPKPSQFYDVDRDALERTTIEQGLARDIPMLGICRGHQLINVLHGGTLHLDIRDMRNKTLNRRGLMSTKTVHACDGSRLQKITGKRVLKVNSLHFQAVATTGESVRSMGSDLDGFCQSIEVEGREIVGVQWHPEYLFYLPAQLRLFQWLVQAARRQRDAADVT